MPRATSCHLQETTRGPERVPFDTEHGYFPRTIPIITVS